MAHSSLGQGLQSSSDSTNVGKQDHVSHMYIAGAKHIKKRKENLNICAVRRGARAGGRWGVWQLARGQLHKASLKVSVAVVGISR